MRSSRCLQRSRPPCTAGALPPSIHRLSNYWLIVVQRAVVCPQIAHPSIQHLLLSHGSPSRVQVKRRDVSVVLVCMFEYYTWYVRLHRVLSVERSNILPTLVYLYDEIPTLSYQKQTFPKRVRRSISTHVHQTLCTHPSQHCSVSLIFPYNHITNSKKCNVSDVWKRTL